MITQVLHCPYCQETDIVKHGLSPEGKQRYRCRACLEGRGRTFLLAYSYAGQSSAVKQQIVDMGSCTSILRLIRQPDNRVKSPHFSTCMKGFCHGLPSLFLSVGADRSCVAVPAAPLRMAK